MSEEISFERLTTADKEIVRAAQGVVEHGYDPYARFLVGAAAQAADGRIFTGVNVATASYVGLCAESVALASGITQGIYRFTTVALVPHSDHFPVTIISGPCGRCRQLLWELSELAGEPIRVLSTDSAMTRVLITDAQELLPHGFGPRLCGGKVALYER
jgi:cytidine deaminase